MKNIKTTLIILALSTPLIAEWCECSIAGGPPGGHLTIGYNCDGSGSGVIQTFTHDDPDLAISTRIVNAGDLVGRC